MDIYYDYNSLTEVVTNENAINNSLKNILLTRIGSLPGKPTFGSHIPELLFDFEDSITEGLLINYIIDAILEWEPRITIKNVEIKSIPEYNRMIANITYEYKMMGKNVTEVANILLKD